MSNKKDLHTFWNQYQKKGFLAEVKEPNAKVMLEIDKIDSKILDAYPVNVDPKNPWVDVWLNWQSSANREKNDTTEEAGAVEADTPRMGL